MFSLIGAQITALDDRVLLWANQFSSRWHGFDEWVAWSLSAPLVKFGPITLAICWLWFQPGPKQAENRQLLIEAMLAGFAALVIGRLCALGLPYRLRPFMRPELHLAVPFDPGLRTWSSFPSDHAAMAFALAAGLFRVSRPIGAWAFLHATLIICLPRLYFGLHHPSDLIGGAALGVMTLWALSRVPALGRVVGGLLTHEQRYAGAFYTFAFLFMYEVTEMFGSMRLIASHAFAALR